MKTEPEYQPESKPSALPTGSRVRRASEAYQYLKDHGFADREQETFVALFLDGNGFVISHFVVAIGNDTTVDVPFRPLLRAALEANAFAMCVSHNHPQGLADPSDPDKMTTRNLAIACQIIDVHLVDHLVTTPTGFTSIRNIDSSAWNPPKSWEDYTSALTGLLEQLERIIPKQAIDKALNSAGLKRPKK
jgi:DNA repair protein RadC